MCAKRMMIEEKRQIMLDVFTKNSFYKMQELEKIGSKKGIVENTVKDVVTGLLHDDLISGDKIGISIFYWGNQNKEKHRKMQELKKLHEEIEKYEELLRKSQEEVELEKKTKPETENRRDLINKLNDLKNQQIIQQELLKGYSKLSKEEVEEIERSKEETIKEINRLTDNIFILQDYVCGKFNMEKKDFNEAFKVSPEMDYL
ncbi:Meiotic nuclear division protein 1 like protein [Nosema granulosis]|uniref:Meiotic nuclear division protein 1 n=1 Tax=Nosema granulosis TaxID=83296 RepID=A0A9P6GYM1_9MICR|nr:Meiotic nuclear division protein 1 like protein [Nosema granulosis]